MDGYSLPDSFLDVVWDAITFKSTPDGVFIDCKARPVAMALLSAHLIAQLQSLPEEMQAQLHEIHSNAIAGFRSLPEELHFLIWGPIAIPPSEPNDEV